ncbi:glutamyl-tRNA amidotransferase [Tsukamurella asaccharolytica]|uniref:Glutamyl-tRNA amidotransferase n=2 Tax=Tsukamurella asaccharolytica TaxID=2592067 RepID=A0A5C5RHC4_9ACTN|nr:glutamyl-tRNA amidotransferase [Tsukamurella asaccharolytica]
MVALSAPPQSLGAPRIDGTIWREYGTPLVPSAGSGPLTGRTVAVKDLFAVRGYPLGAGNPTFRRAAARTSTADAVTRLQRAGAAIAGIAATDEFAYSLAGTNGHYGTPPNGLAPDRIPGGSSSGSASAVALGLADIGLGTDTGGSIRVPASYQGLYGLRTTHGAVGTSGLLPLAQSFDTVGWITRTPDLLAEVADVLLGGGVPVREALFAPALADLAEPAVANRVRGAVTRWRVTASLPVVTETAWDTSAQADAVRAFQTVQGYEAWRNHGAWVSSRWDSLNPDVRSRFEKAATYTGAARDAAAAELAEFRAGIDRRLGDAVLVLPTASSWAPLRSEAAIGGPAIERTRAATFQLTCIAGITGRPAVSVPIAADPGTGLCVVGPRGSDRALGELAVRLRANGIAR